MAKLSFTLLHSHLPPTQEEPGAPSPNALFDESGNFLIYCSLIGIKVVNLVSNTVSCILGGCCEFVHVSKVSHRMPCVDW